MSGVEIGFSGNQHCTVYYLPYSTDPTYVVQYIRGTVQYGPSLTAEPHVSTDDTAPLAVPNGGKGERGDPGMTRGPRIVQQINHLFPFVHV